jgi:hypothetical protein
MRLLEDVSDQSVVLTETQTSIFDRYHTGSVLSTMLKDRQTIEKLLVNMLFFVGK